MTRKRPTANIRLVVLELTTANGETTGSVEMSVTENGQTRTMRREIGKPAPKLSNPTPQKDRADG